MIERDHPSASTRDIRVWIAVATSGLFGSVTTMSIRMSWPNGNFSFTFFISLKAEQDVKFNYNRSDYRVP